MEEVEHSSSVDNASIHGLRDLARLGHVFKLIWLAFLIAAFCGSYVHCWNMVLDATGEDIRTYVENFRDNGGFPPIMICPTHMKYDRAKVEQMMYDRSPSTSMSKSFELQVDYMLNYLTSLETLNYIKGTISQTYPRWDYNNTIRHDIYDVLIGNSSYTNLEMDLTLDFDDVVIEIPGYPVVNKRKIMSVYGACYTFELSTAVSLPLNNIYSVQLALKRDFHKTINDIRPHGYFFTYNADLLFFGASSFWPKSSTEHVFQSEEYFTVDKSEEGATCQSTRGSCVIKVRLDYQFDLLISSTTVNRVNRRSSPCRDWSEQDQSICMVQCYNDEFCSKMPTPCLLFHPNQTSQQQYKRLCSMLNDKELFYLTQKTSHCAMQPEIFEGKAAVNNICKLRCPARCVEAVYYVTHSRFERRIYKEDDPEYEYVHWANVTLRYQDFNRRLIVHERLSWKSDTFVASYASAMSLWTGVSGLAIVELFFILLQSTSRGVKRIREKQQQMAGVTLVVFLLLLGLGVLLILTLFKLRSIDSSPPVIDVSSDDLWDNSGKNQPSWKYQGCFSNPNGSLLRGLHDSDSNYTVFHKLNYTKDAEDGLESVTHCLSACAGFIFAGMQDGVGCMCGDSIHADVSLEELRQPDDQCNLPCNPTVSPSRCEYVGCPTRCGEAQCCGGQGKIDLYKMEGKEYTTKGRFLGCVGSPYFWSFCPRPELLLTDKTNANDSALPGAEVNVNTCAEFCKGYHWMDSCTTIVENAELSWISAWVNEPSNPVHCKEGYSLTGPQILHCNASKVWQETTMPTCV